MRNDAEVSDILIRHRAFLRSYFFILLLYHTLPKNAILRREIQGIYSENRNFPADFAVNLTKKAVAAIILYRTDTEGVLQMAVRIIADSTCDLSQELIARYGITIMPLYVSLEDESYRDGVNITAADIFRHVDSGGALPKTAAVSAGEFLECIASVRADHPDDEVILITISAEFSSCYQNAVIAAESSEGVYAVDSRNLSTGFGHVVLTAAELAEEGLSAAEITEKLREIIPLVDASFILNRLDYLRKGGRCSAIAALGANLLKLKPCIAVRDGKMTVVKKYRGNYEKCVEQYVRDRLSTPEQIVPHRIFITHAAASAEAVQTADRTIRSIAPFDSITETTAGCTVSSHCGPGTLGVLFIRKP